VFAEFSSTTGDRHRTPMQVHELLRTESSVGLLSVFMFTTARLWIFMRRLCSNFSVWSILRFLPDDTTTLCCIGVMLISNAARNHAITSLCNPLFSAHTGPVMTIISTTLASGVPGRETRTLRAEVLSRLKFRGAESRADFQERYTNCSRRSPVSPIAKPESS
jgi:hypothetical protein